MTMRRRLTGRKKAHFANHSGMLPHSSGSDPFRTQLVGDKASHSGTPQSQRDKPTAVFEEGWEG